MPRGRARTATAAFADDRQIDCVGHGSVIRARVANANLGTSVVLEKVDPASTQSVQITSGLVQNQSPNSPANQQLLFLRSRRHLPGPEVSASDSRAERGATCDPVALAGRRHRRERDDTAAATCRGPESHADAGDQVPNDLLESRRLMPRHLQHGSPAGTAYSDGDANPVITKALQLMRYLVRTFSLGAIGAALAIAIAACNNQSGFSGSVGNTPNGPKLPRTRSSATSARRSPQPYRTRTRPGRFRATSRSAVFICNNPSRWPRWSRPKPPAAATC